MSIEQMRKAITDKYPSDIWKNKVKKMKDSQVIAIYYKMLNNKEFTQKNPSWVQTTLI